MSDQKNIQKIQPVEKSAKIIRNDVLTNIVKMLTERNMLNKSNLKENIDSLTSKVLDSLVYSIKLDNHQDPEDKASKNMHIKLIPQKITAINKASGISDFLKTYKTDKKIVIVTSVGTKARQFVKANYKNTEIFTEEEMMINLVDNELIPKHEVLEKEEVEKFYKIYHLKKRMMPKIFTNDPVARYYNMKPNDIVRITRPSETSGDIIFYRLVIKGELK